MLDSQSRQNNPREEMAWYTDNISVILQYYGLMSVCMYLCVCVSVSRKPIYTIVRSNKYIC